MIVHRRAGGLDHEDVLAADVLVDLYVDLAVGEPRDVRVTQRELERLGDLLRQRPVRIARHQLRPVSHDVSVAVVRPACADPRDPSIYPLGSPSAAPRQATAGSPSAAPPPAPPPPPTHSGGGPPRPPRSRLPPPPADPLPLAKPLRGCVVATPAKWLGREESNLHCGVQSPES